MPRVRLGCEVSVIDETRRVWLREALRETGEEGVVLGFAVGAQAGDDLSEVGVVVAGVADELKGAVVGKRVEKL